MKRDKRRYFICRYIKFRYILNLFITEGLFRGNKIVLYYLNPNSVSILLEKLINLLTKEQNRNFSFLHCNYDISMMKNEKGIPLIKASGCDDLNEIINKIDKMELDEGSSVFDCLNEKLSHLRKDLRLYIKQQVALDIFNDLLMANVTYWFSTNMESELYGKNPVLLIEKKSYWSYLVLDYLKDKDVNFKAFRQLNLKRNKGILFTYHLIKLFVELVRLLARGQISKEPSGKAKIGVPFYAMQNFTNFLDLRNYYLFWFYKSEIDPNNILIYVPEAEFKISDEEVSNIKKAGLNITYCPTRIISNRNSSVPAYQCSFKVVSSLLQYLKQIFKIYIYASGIFMREQWKILSLLFIQLPYWEDFFQKNNIKIKFRFHDIFGVRDIASKLSGVTTMSYHYSNHSDARITREEVCDVFFLWGSRYKTVLSPEHSTTKSLIETGYVFDYTFNYLKEKASELKDFLKQSNATYTIAILDENISKHLNYFTESILRLYRTVFEYAVTNYEVGIILKPKKEITVEYLTTHSETAELLLELKSQKRVIILNNHKYPVEAGFASDLAIGVIPDSTAGLECVLAGIPMVICDCTNRKESHPLYKAGRNKVIFDDIQYLIEAIDKNRKKPGSIPGFADWSFILNEVDPFRDGKANQRIANYIKTILLKSSNGLSKNEVIETANRAYAEEFGWDKVISLSCSERGCALRNDKQGTTS